MQKKTYLAIDLGASSGRVVAGSYDGKTLDLEVVHSFSTLPFDLEGTLRIDLESFHGEILLGIHRVMELFGEVVSVGVDSWGGQIVLIDSNGKLIETPYHYRDPVNHGFMEEVHDRMSAMELYRITGLQESQLSDWLAHRHRLSHDIESADRLLQIPDFFNFRLCGNKVNEYSNALQTQFVNTHTRNWSEVVLEKMDLPRRLLGEIAFPGTYIGDLATKPIRVVAVASHDTSSALAATPLKGERSAFISLGTWAIMGFEVAEPLITVETFSAGIQNSSIFGRTFALSRLVIGLWILEECRRTWQSEGREYSFPQLVALASEADSFTAVLSTDSQTFFAPGDMVSRIRRICGETGQRVPENDGEVVRIVLEGLALSFRHFFQSLESSSGYKADSINVVGGGSRNALLNQFTADACGIPIIAGPAEATAAGNIIAQLMADEEFESLEEGRELISESFPRKIFVPREQTLWDDADERFSQLWVK